MANLFNLFESELVKLLRVTSSSYGELRRGKFEGAELLQKYSFYSSSLLSVQLKSKMLASYNIILVEYMVLFPSENLCRTSFASEGIQTQFP